MKIMPSENPNYGSLEVFIQNLSMNLKIAQMAQGSKVSSKKGVNLLGALSCVLKGVFQFEDVDAFIQYKKEDIGTLAIYSQF